jgi:hypothetical protein
MIIELIWIANIDVIPPAAGITFLEASSYHLLTLPRPGDKDKTYNPSTAMNSPVALWPAATLAFLILSSVLFAWLFEWDRYQVITAYRLHSLSLLDQILLFWLLVAKSLGWFVPLLLMAAVLIALGLTRIALLVLNCFWIGIFYFMAVDLVAVNYTAYHAWEYWLPMREILAHPQHQLTRWLTEELTAETLVVFGVFAISGPLCFVFCRQTAMRLGRVFPRLGSPQAATLMMVLFVFSIGEFAGFVPVRDQRTDRTLLLYRFLQKCGKFTGSRREIRRPRSAGSHGIVP